MNRHIIGIAGKARTGKDTVADYLVRAHGYYAMSFADPIKTLVITGGKLEAYYQQHKEEPVPGLDMSYRQACQLIGDALRPDGWIRMLQRRLDRTPQYRIVVSDVRYENEADWVRSHGGILLHLTRDAAEPAHAHSSEVGIEAKFGDYIIANDASLEQLHEQLDELLESYA